MRALGPPRTCCPRGTERESPKTMNCPACGTANPLSNRFCRSCGTGLEARPRSVTAQRRLPPSGPTPKVSIESERRRVVATILFADMTGFTARAERLGDPEKAQDLISLFYTEMTACVR